MNRLKHDRRENVLRLLVEGCSVASITRLTGVAKATVLRIVREFGLRCWAFHDAYAHGLHCTRLEIDETWSFVAMKRKNVPEEKRGVFGNGDVWNWTALDYKSRFLVCWFFADHSSESAHAFMGYIRERVLDDFEISTDGLHSYPRAIDEAFGPYAMQPLDPTGSSTNRIERWNLTLRMGNRRFTRSTNAFSRSLENHFFMMAIFAFHYNFVRKHSAVRATPAEAVGLTARPLIFDDLLMVEAVGQLDLAAARIACDALLKVETAKILLWGESSKVRTYTLIRQPTSEASA